MKCVDWRPISHRDMAFFILPGYPPASIRVPKTDDTYKAKADTTAMVHPRSTSSHTVTIILNIQTAQKAMRLQSAKTPAETTKNIQPHISNTHH